MKPDINKIRVIPFTKKKKVLNYQLEILLYRE
jgi:hypothetical protein